MKRRVLKGLLACILCLVAAEALARVVFDFPLYEADDELGYWPRANQEGAFLFRNDWAFNSTSLGVEKEFQPSAKLDVLLVGDSIVYGGNELQQAQKLGPMLQQETGWAVWPAGAGSWALQNELTFLGRHPELVAGSDVIAFVVNSGDFGSPSEWRSAFTHPREKPPIFLIYLFQRYVLPLDPPPASPMPVRRADLLAWWTDFATSTNKPLIVFAYSNQGELAQRCTWVPRHLMARGSWYCYDGKKLPGTAGFRDDIHPSVRGNQVLAGQIAQAIRANMEEPPAK